MPRFDKTYCSQCGGEFGPRDSGFSHCDQHTGLVDTDEDELEAEEFYAMSDAQQDAAVEREMKRYYAALDRLSPLQLYQYRRQRTLDLILKQRRLVKEFPGVDSFRDMLRSAQRRLLIWRTEYRTGSPVGSA